MKFKMIHENLNVSDLDRSLLFYDEALDLHEVRRKTSEDFIIYLFVPPFLKLMKDTVRKLLIFHLVSMACFFYEYCWKS